MGAGKGQTRRARSSTRQLKEVPLHEVKEAHELFTLQEDQQRSTAALHDLDEKIKETIKLGMIVSNAHMIVMPPSRGERVIKPGEQGVVSNLVSGGIIDVRWNDGIYTQLKVDNIDCLYEDITPPLHASGVQRVGF